MQRRATAAYFLLFLVVGVGAYAIVTTVSVPAERAEGLWTVAILSIITAILVAGMAYLPVRG